MQDVQAHVRGATADADGVSAVVAAGDFPRAARHSLARARAVFCFLYLAFNDPDRIAAPMGSVQKRLPGMDGRAARRARLGPFALRTRTARSSNKLYTRL